MTNHDKEQIRKLRLEGSGYGKIAQILNLPKSTVSSFCKTITKQSLLCLHCNKKLKQTKGHRQKKYCSDECRMSYWKSNKAEINRKPEYLVECFHCHTSFSTYQSLKRKYCSRDCYFKNRVENMGNG